MSKSRVASSLLPYGLLARVLAFACMAGLLAPNAGAQESQSTDLDALRVRLAAVEKEVAELRRALGASQAPHDAGQVHAPDASQVQAPDAGQIEALDQRIRILDRRFELEQERAAETAKVTASVDAGRSGFTIKSADGAFNLRLRGLVHADSRWFLDDDANAAADTFVARRVRPIVQATLFKVVDFRVTPDFGDGRTVIQDAYMDLRLKPMARIRGGKFKAPFGLERLASASDLLFIERAAPTLVAPNRDMGVMLWGETTGAVVSYAAGVFNGVVDGGSTDADDHDGKDATARIFVQPFARSTTRDRLQGLGLGVAVSYGDVTGTVSAPNLASYRTTGGQTFYRYRTDVVADGTRKRVSPQAYYYAGRLGFVFEHASSWQQVRRGASGADAVPVHASQVAGSWVLSGERAAYRGVVPRRNFEPAKGAWGAFEVAARYHQWTVGDEAFPQFADPGVSAKVARVWTAGLNWYLNPAFKVVLDYEETRFDGGGAAGTDRPTARDLFTRLQVSF